MLGRDSVGRGYYCWMEHSRGRNGCRDGDFDENSGRGNTNQIPFVLTGPEDPEFLLVQMPPGNGSELVRREGDRLLLGYGDAPWIRIGNVLAEAGVALMTIGAPSAVGQRALIRIGAETLIISRMCAAWFGTLVRNSRGRISMWSGRGRRLRRSCTLRGQTRRSRKATSLSAAPRAWTKMESMRRKNPFWSLMQQTTSVRPPISTTPGTHAEKRSHVDRGRVLGYRAQRELHRTLTPRTRPVDRESAK